MNLNAKIHRKSQETNYNDGFLDGSDGKESACNVGDLGLIPELGRSSGGGHGNPLQYSWRIPMDRGWQATVHGVTMQYNEMQLSKSEKPNLCHSNIYGSLLMH